ncbi:hypothetical protein FOA52_014509 [Chlamydomonas sp. UWO 241]|nr:hypothetical protein FOA52_014509 [Chlamydomonas sp. UWO 241]
MRTPCKRDPKALPLLFNSVAGDRRVETRMSVTKRTVVDAKTFKEHFEVRPAAQGF